MKSNISNLMRKVKHFQPKSGFKHDRFIKETLLEALDAVKEGNFGVGAVLVDKKNNIVEREHNKVFNPYFRSDRHAEMEIITTFEKKNKTKKNPPKVKLFVSLEPCPMCTSRILTSSIKEVYYGARYKSSGMLSKISCFPETLQEYSKTKVLSEACCSEELKELSREIIAIERDDKYERVLNN